MSEAELLEELDKLPGRDKENYILDTIKSYPNYYILKNRLANQYINKDEIVKAKVFLEKELSNKYNVHLQITLANLQIKCNNIEAAKKTIAKLKEKNPKSPHTYVVAGRLNVKEGFEDEAIKSFETAHELNPKVVKPVIELQDLYVKGGNFEKAKSLVQSAIKHRPKNHIYQICLGKIWQKLGEDKNAHEAFETARQLAPNNSHAGNVAIQLALLKINQSSDSEVIHQLRHFIQLYPKHTGLRINLIRFLINNRFYTDALVEIKILQEIAPDEVRALVNKAIIYQKQGLLEEAKVLCNLIIEKKPNHLNGLLLKADLLNLQGKTKEAYILFKRSMDTHPTSASVYARFAQFLFLEGQVEQSLSILDNGISKSKNIENLWYKSIQILMHIGSYDKAISLIHNQKYLNTKSSYRVKYFEMQLYQRMGNFEKAKRLALEFLRDCRQGSNWNTDIYRFLSETAFMEYDYKKAEGILKDLVNSAKDANILRNRLSLLYILKGDLKNAKKQLQIATQEIVAKETAGKVLIPLIGHTAKVLNEILLNPPLQLKAIDSFKYSGRERLEYLAELNSAHPDYFGFSLYLSNELRAQSILKSVNDSLNLAKSTTKIPKTIIQYWDSGTPPTSVHKVMQSWKENNPNYKYHLFSRKSAYSFLKRKLGHESAVAFQNCEHPAMQADFFRLAYLYTEGGFYADADDKCVKPLDKLRESGAELVLKLGDFGCISNNFIGAVPKNDIIQDAFQKGMTNMLTYFNEGPWFKLGPGHFTKSVTFQLSKFIQEKDFTKWPRIYTLDQLETRRFLSQHLSLPYKSGDKSWFTAEYKKTISKTKIH